MSDENVDSPETWDEMDELEPTAEELAEAASLARMMDGDFDAGDAAGVDEGAFETASLLAYSKGSGELRAERADAVLEEVLKSARRPTQAAFEAKAEPKRSFWRWLLPVPLVGAAALAALLVSSPSAAVLPVPSMSLIQAQATAAAGEDPAGLDEEMNSYRSELYAALEEGY